MPDSDPRVFFAAERTLLAWVRTGLGLVGMGFVVARFGLFLRLLHPNAVHPDHAWAGPIGVAIALLGSLATGLATWQHRRFCRTLGTSEMPRSYRAEPALVLGVCVALAGVVLAIVIVS